VVFLAQRETRVPWHTSSTRTRSHEFFLAQDVVYRSPLSLHGVSHDNMSHDSDQGLTVERAEENKYIGL